MNIQKISLALLLLSFIAFTSCRDQESTEATPTQSAVETNENPKTTAALNPPHGQPGHRCDIPVGADLNEASTTTNTNTVQQTNNTTVSPVRLNSATPAKNPEHGQPGHRCDIPVGADL